MDYKCVKYTFLSSLFPFFFFLTQVRATDEEKDFMSIGMTMQFFYSGNEITGYRASNVS